MRSINQDKHSFSLDLHDGTDVKLSFKQFDNEVRTLETQFTIHNDNYDLKDARVDLWVFKPDNTVAIKQANIIDVENGIIDINLTRQMLACAGSPVCEYVITFVDKRVISFPPFVMEVKPSLYDEDKIASTDEFNLFFDSLARMEDWILQFTNKFNVITSAFDNKMQEVTTIFNEFHINQNTRFDNLYKTVVNQVTEGFSNQYLKNKQDFLVLKTEINEQFAIKGREIEKRFNILEQKAIEQSNTIETKMNISIENTNVILANRTESDSQLGIITNNTQESRTQLDGVNKYITDTEVRVVDLEGRMNEFDSHYAQAKLDETERQRQENIRQTQEVTRQSNETSRVTAETKRVTDFDTFMNTSTSTFDQAETQRQVDEVIRIQNEIDRGLVESTRQTSETSRQEQESIRVATEQERQVGYTQMQTTVNEIYTTTLKYRIVTE